MRPGQLGHDARVWTERRPRVVPPEQSVPELKQAPFTQPRRVVGERRASGWGGRRSCRPTAWRRLTVAEGSQGPRVYEYAEVWAVWFSEEELPGPRGAAAGAAIVGPVGSHEGAEIPPLERARPRVPLLKLAQVRATRWTIEEDIKSGKGQCGLDEYETRGRSGWHHHTALSMLATAFPGACSGRGWGERAGDDRTRGAERYWSTCWRCEPGTWARSSGGQLGVAGGIAERPSAIASGGSPSEGDVSEVRTREPAAL